MCSLSTSQQFLRTNRDSAPDISSDEKNVTPTSCVLFHCFPKIHPRKGFVCFFFSSGMLETLSIGVLLLVVSTTTASTCSLTASVNVSVGTQTAKSKFVVSAQDCCGYCDSTPNCVAAVFDQYYCQPFSQVTTTVPSNTGVFIQPLTPTPAPSGQPSPGPSQPTIPPSEQLHYYFLTTCEDSNLCDPVGDETCSVQVVQPNVCSFDNYTSLHVLVTSNANGAVRLTFNNSDCQGAPLESDLYPFECAHVKSRFRRSFLLTNFTSNLTTAYVATSSTCLIQNCNTSCLVDFTGSTGVCGTTGTQDSGASSYAIGSNSFIPTSSNGYMLCFEAVEMMATFSFPSAEKCSLESPAVGYALPTNKCLIDGRQYIRNVCSETMNF